MLTITYRHNRQSLTEEWQVGDPAPNIAAFKVQEIAASEAEAAHIEEMMGGGINRPVQRFFGDVARTIYLNLV